LFNLPTGWLSPTGDFYECAVYEHIAMARELIHTEHRADEILVNGGWVSITISQLGNKEYYIWWKNFLQDEQKNFLKKYFENESVPVSYMSKMRWNDET